MQIIRLVRNVVGHDGDVIRRVGPDIFVREAK